jgi:hypothetical protein
MTARKTQSKPPAKPEPGWTSCPDCGHRSTGRIQHGPHPKVKA